jgi:hypothetical protein
MSSEIKPNQQLSPPEPTVDIYQYAEVDGYRPVVDVYKTTGDTVDIGGLAVDRTWNFTEQAVGPIVVVTQAETPGEAEGKKEIRMYEVTSKYFVNPQSGQYAEIDPSQLQPITIGSRWQSPMGKTTKFPVRFIARPRTNAYRIEDISTDHDKPKVQSPTTLGQQHLKQLFGEDADWG